MFNFKYQSDMTFWTYSQEQNGFVVRCKYPVAKGEEIFVFYGNKPNTSFLLFYGFVVENNENDEIQLTITLEPKDLLKRHKEALLKKESVVKKFKLTATTEDAKFHTFIKYARFAVYEGPKEALPKVLSDLNILFSY